MELNHPSGYTVEMKMLLALKWVEEHKPEDVLMCSDSAAVLNRLRSIKSNDQDILFSILHIDSRVVQNDTSVSLIWVPAHIGIRGH